jgi:hypothetical protein
MTLTLHREKAQCFKLPGLASTELETLLDAVEHELMDALGRPIKWEERAKFLPTEDGIYIFLTDYSETLCQWVKTLDFN